MEVHCDTLAVMGATLANGGVCPVTREAALAPEAVRDVLSLMHSCGMYNYSGQVCSHQPNSILSAFSFLTLCPWAK